MPCVKPKPTQPSPASSNPPPSLLSSHPLSDIESPPASPASSFPAISDDELSDSWLEVEEQSSVGPSVLGDPAFSDSSSDSHDHEHDHDHDNDQDLDRHSHTSADDEWEHSDIGDDQAVFIANSSIGEEPSLAGGEYTDAEASTSKLGSSIGTIQKGLASTASSQIRLIFPDPGASFATSSGTLSAGFTPSASVSDMTPLPQPDQTIRRRADTHVANPLIPASGPVAARLSPRRSSSPVTRGVEDSWLRSSKLWEPPKEIIPSTINEGHRYRLLASTDDVDQIEEEAICSGDDADGGNGLKMPTVDVNEDLEKEAVNFPEFEDGLKEKSFPVILNTDNDLRLHQLELQRALRKDNVTQLKAAAKKWSTRVSLLALASVISLALFRSFGTTAPIPSVQHATQDSSASKQSVEPPVMDEKVSSFWDTLLFSPLLLGSSPHPSASDTAITTATHQDLQVIKQALSTLSTIQGMASSGAAKSSTTGSHEVKTDNPVKPKDANIRSSTSCCSVSIRNNDVALTIPIPPPSTQLSIAQKLSQKILGPNTSALPVVENQTTPATECACSLSTAVQTEVLERISAALNSTMSCALTTSHYLNDLFGPIISSVEKEFAIVLNVTRHLAGSASSASHNAIHRAAKGVSISSNKVNSAVHQSVTRMSSFFSTKTASTKEDSLARAQAILESLSDYVDAKLDGVSEMIEEQAEAMQEKGTESIFKAKKGLDRLIREAKRLHIITEEEKTITPQSDVGKGGPLPFSQMKEGIRSKFDRQAREQPRQRDRTIIGRRGTAKRERRKDRIAEEKGSRLGVRGRKVKLNAFVPPLPLPDKPTRAKRMLDAVHHGAMAFVL